MSKCLSARRFFSFMSCLSQVCLGSLSLLRRTDGALKYYSFSNSFLFQKIYKRLTGRGRSNHQFTIAVLSKKGTITKISLEKYFNLTHIRQLIVFFVSSLCRT